MALIELTDHELNVLTGIIDGEIDPHDTENESQYLFIDDLYVKLCQSIHR